MLQRLFLSYNSIGSIANLNCLGAISSLLELALDGNPVALDASYRPSLLQMAPTIRHLDLRRVTEEEKRAALAHSRREVRSACPFSHMRREERYAVHNPNSNHDSNPKAAGSNSGPSARGARGREADGRPSGT